MLTREDFQKAIEASVDKYPAVGSLHRARDPRILQNLDAMATMLAMYSQQVQIAQAEPFDKVRDATVLADASMRGLIPQSKPARITVAVKNDSHARLVVDSARPILDSNGRRFRVETPTEVEPGETGTFTAVQVHEKTVKHVVGDSIPFYAVEIETADDDSWLCGLHVSDDEGAYEHRERYTNTFAGERIYHVEADERQRVHVRFGQNDVVGVQPRNGQQITLTCYYSLGLVDDFEPGSPVMFEAMRSPNEAQVEMLLSAVLESGENPPSIAQLRELAKYPSIYNHNAVFLGEFDFLVRRHFPSLQFLSVWNEAAEEAQRGPSLDNINALFVACLSDIGDEQVLLQGAEQEVQPSEIPESEWTGTQKAIREKIRLADDSYKVRFFTPVRAPIEAAITATVPSSYDETVVAGQIRQVMLEEFGELADRSRRGNAVPLYQQIYQLLKANVAALSVGTADLRVTLNEQGGNRPELWRYISPDSLQVVVTAGDSATPHWGAGL